MKNRHCNRVGLGISSKQSTNELENQTKEEEWKSFHVQVSTGGKTLSTLRDVVVAVVGSISVVSMAKVNGVKGDRTVRFMDLFFFCVGLGVIFCSLPLMIMYIVG